MCRIFKCCFVSYSVLKSLCTYGLFIHTSVHTYILAYSHAYSTYICMHIFMYICLYISWIYSLSLRGIKYSFISYLYIYFHTHMNAHTCTHTYIHTYMHNFRAYELHAYVHTYMHNFHAYELHACTHTFHTGNVCEVIILQYTSCCSYMFLILVRYFVYN